MMYLLLLFLCVLEIESNGFLTAVDSSLLHFILCIGAHHQVCSQLQSFYSVAGDEQLPSNCVKQSFLEAGVKRFMMSSREFVGGSGRVIEKIKVASAGVPRVNPCLRLFEGKDLFLYRYIFFLLSNSFVRDRQQMVYDGI